MGIRQAQHPRRASRRKAAMERQEKAAARSLEERIQEQLQFNPGVLVNLENNTYVQGASTIKKELKKLLQSRARIQQHLKDIKTTVSPKVEPVKTKKVQTLQDFILDGKLTSSMSALRMMVTVNKLSVNDKVIADLQLLKTTTLKLGDVVKLGSKTITVE